MSRARTSSIVDETFAPARRSNIVLLALSRMLNWRSSRSRKHHRRRDEDYPQSSSIWVLLSAPYNRWNLSAHHPHVTQHFDRHRHERNFRWKGKYWPSMGVLSDWSSRLRISSRITQSCCRLCAILYTVDWFYYHDVCVRHCGSILRVRLLI